jgi:hypothetical protein
LICEATLLEKHVRLLLALLSGSALLAGCAGYAIDYTKPKTSIVGAELKRYGFDGSQAQCVGGRLGAALSVWQLRQLQIGAASVTKGFSDPSRLTPSDLVWVSRNVEDKRVGPAVAAAVAACEVSAPAVTAAAPPLSAIPAPQGATGAAAATAWVNLGAAPTGQAIAVDAASLSQEGSYRSGWFRLTNPGQGRGASSYLLRVDCTARTINSMAVRKPVASGFEQKDFGPNGEGAAPIENGTVMQIAFLALCT